MITERLIAFKTNFNNIIELRDFLLELRRVRKVADTELLPLIEKYRRTMKTPSNKIVKEIIHQMKRNSDVLNERDIFEDFKTALETIVHECTVMEHRIEAEEISVFIGDDIDIKHFHSLRLLSAADFINKSIRSFTVCAVELEVMTMRGEQERDYRSTINFLDHNFKGDNLRAFSRVLGFFKANHNKSVAKDIYELEDITVTPEVLSLIESTEGGNKLDPVGLTLLDFVNPLFYLSQPAKIWSAIKMWYIDYEKEELLYLEARHAELVALKQDGVSNPHDERIINKYRDAIETSRRNIKRVKATMG